MYEIIQSLISDLASIASNITSSESLVAYYRTISGHASNLASYVSGFFATELVPSYSRFLSEYSQVILFFVPLGIIGAWRWGVWIIRKIISLFYKAPGGDYRGTLSIVTPVYNEDPDYFRAALESWKKNQPAEIIAVIDQSDSQNINEFRNFSRTFPGSRLIVTPKPGKREALADGILAARSEIVALVDSDTIWSEGIIPQMIAPFSDPQVGGTGPRQDVLGPKTLAQRLFKIRLDNRFFMEIKYLAAAGDALTCLSGRTAVYRRKALLPHLKELVSEKFWGRKLVSGDDKTLTRLVQQSGWKTKYIDEAVVYTPGFSDMRKFLKQILRWSRNSWRSDIQTLRSRWVWKREKALAFHMVDRFFPPFTMPLGPIFFFTSIFFGYWEAALALFVWWMLSRAIKIYPHLREKPGDLFIMPIYVVMTYVESMIKLYALATIDESDWSTRWDLSRVDFMRPMKKTVAYLTTFSIVFGLFFFVFNFKSEDLRASQVEKQMAREAKEAENLARLSIYTDVPRTSAQTISQAKADLLAESQGDPYGYYTAEAGDSVALLKSRYNLSGSGMVLDARTKTPLSDFAFLSAGQQVAISAENLRNPLDDASLLAGDRFREPPRVTYDSATNTIFVRQDGSLATPKKIRAALGPANASLLEELSPGEWILRANLYIGQDVTFVASPPEVSHLKLKSDSQSAVWVRGESGNFLFENTKVTSWDENKDSFDENNQDGRAFVAAKSSGRMDVINSEMAYLGYAGGPIGSEERGGPFGGSYGVSWKIENGGLYIKLLTGVVLDSKFHHNYFGFYTYGATGMLVQDSEFYDNVEYGMDPHDDSNNFLVEGNSAHNNGNHGIIFSRRCFSNVIKNNVSYNNRLHGIMLDRSSNKNIIEGNTAYGNVDGIVIYESDSNIVIGNEIRNNEQGIRLNQNSAKNYFEGNDVLQNSRGAYLYGGVTENILVNNKIEQNTIGITLKEGASNNILHDNFAQSSNARDGRVTEDALGNDIK